MLAADMCCTAAIPTLERCYIVVIHTLGMDGGMRLRVQGSSQLHETLSQKTISLVVIPSIPALRGRPTSEFEAILLYRVSSRTANKGTQRNPAYENYTDSSCSYSGKDLQEFPS